jgi:prepilin-type N-terminal cleavage/methylation domain-containing protein
VPRLVKHTPAWQHQRVDTMRSYHDSDSGYTLIEVMIVLVILAILVLIAVMSYVVATGNARAVSCRHNQRIFNDAVILYENETDTLPNSIDDLDDYVHDPDANKLCTNQDGVELTYNDVTERVTCANHP